MSPILEKIGIYAHKDADKAGHTGHDTDKETKNLLVPLSCPVCQCFVRVFMSVDASPARPGTYPQRARRSQNVMLQSQSVSHGHVPDSLD